MTEKHKRGPNPNDSVPASPRPPAPRSWAAPVNDNLTPPDENPTGKPAEFADRKGDWIQTFSGGMFFPLDPRASEINIDDIAHALSMQCRFGGHCNWFYTVAEHSVHIANWLIQHRHSRETVLWGLLHDASEAYLVDLPRPIKVSLPEYKRAEHRIQNEIAIHFGLPLDIPEAVHAADQRILTDEMQQIMAPPPAPWATVLEPLGVDLLCWHPEYAEEKFLELFGRLSGAEGVAA